MVTETDVALADGSTLHAYDTAVGARSGDGPRSGSGSPPLPVCWFHGTPNLGTPPTPLFAAADRLGLRWVSYDRPGYGGSTRRPGRDLASAAGDVAAVADALGIARFAVFGHSGGAPHALACAALLPDRVVAAVGVAGLAPLDAVGLEWFAGMAASGQASLRAAAGGRAAKEDHEASGVEYDPEFTAGDLAALNGEWSWFGGVVEAAVASAVRGVVPGLVDDDLAYVAPWGFDPAQIRVPLLLLHGGRDRVVPASHSRWLAGRCAGSELRFAAEEGHISVLRQGPEALEWLRRVTTGATPR